MHTRRLKNVNSDFKQTMQSLALLSGTQTGDSDPSGDCCTSTATETRTLYHNEVCQPRQFTNNIFFILEPQKHCRVKKCAKNVAGGLNCKSKTRT